jgi:cyclic pyranopterin phosphate synthase
MCKKNHIPTYARLVLTNRCLNKCPYCHSEGSSQSKKIKEEVSIDDIKNSVRFLLKNGFRKFKLLGGEPFLRKGLCDIISYIKNFNFDIDCSLITSCVFPIEKYFYAIESGLDRINITMHGFTQEAFKKRNPNIGAFIQRNKNIDTIIKTSPNLVKINYVYSGKDDYEDLNKFIQWASVNKHFISILDNLNKDFSWHNIFSIITKIKNSKYSIYEKENSNCLPTLILKYEDGLKLEIKNSRVSNNQFYYSCSSCRYISKCKEGIFAFRLNSKGNLQPCLVRNDNEFPLFQYLHNLSERELNDRFINYIEKL